MAFSGCKRTPGLIRIYAEYLSSDEQGLLAQPVQPIIRSESK